MTVEYFNTFVNICAEHSWYVLASNGQKVEFDDLEEIRKHDYPYEPQDFADYIGTVFETLRNDETKIMDPIMGVPIYPHHAETSHQRTAFLQWFQEIYDHICTQGYSPMSESDTEIDNNTNTAVDSDDETDDETDDESEDDNTETNHPLHIINTESENGRVIWFTCFNNERYEVTDNNVIMIYGDMVGNFDQELNHAYFEENYEPHIDVQDFDEIRRLLMFDDEVEEEPQLPEQE
ncbi:MAG: hypothetical protein CL926_11855 [Deltaproteobacteria bacterium]|nr:hypothetical protein [Deltaproteobacteria bacterium]